MDARGGDDIIALRVGALTAYQNAASAARYSALVERVRAAEAEKAKGLTGLAEAVARYYFKLLAYKDEYEIARLLTDPAFERRVAAQFEDGYTLRYHLAPPLLARTDPETGRPRRPDLPNCLWQFRTILCEIRVIPARAVEHSMVKHGIGIQIGLVSRVI